MPEMAVIKFRAKRGVYADTRGEFPWFMREGYKVPALKSHHIETPRIKQGLCHAVLLSAGSEQARSMTTSILKGAGLAHAVFLEDAELEGVTIEPAGKGGLFATVTLVVDLKAMRGGR